MTHRFKGERTLMRVFVGEADKCKAGKFKGKSLYEALLLFFREQDLAGVTVLRGVAGYGAHSRVHTDKLLRLSLDLPMVVEVVDTEAKIQGVLGELDHMIDGGLITLEPVRVILYRPHDVPEDERWLHRVEGLQAEPGSG